MKVLFVAAEMAPYAKVGGLADVIGSLPAALRRRGIDARVVIPDYKLAEEMSAFPIKKATAPFEVKLNEFWTKTATVRQVEDPDLPVYLIGTDEWFQDADRSETVYRPGIDQYLFFSMAALSFFRQMKWVPDVVHAHDWHTGFVPVLMRERSDLDLEEVGSVYTIHNQAYQGEFGIEILDRLNLPHWLYHPDAVEAWGRVNFLKAGAAFADETTTVSESYAREVQTTEFGRGLEGLMKKLDREGRLWGIRNGIDLDVFDPSSDPEIASPYSAEDMAGKAECKRAVMKEVGLEPIPGAPLFGIVSRLSSQKGLDLFLEALPDLVELPAQFIVLGAGEPPILEGLTHMAQRYPKNLAFIEGFHLSLAPRIYAGCDGFLMPSMFEPCGLGQMIAMRYGTVPVVRATGGLADTVEEGYNGFTFTEKTAAALSATVGRAVEAYRKPKSWSKLQKAGMAGDYSWDFGARRYEEVYKAAIKSRAKSVERFA